MLRDSGRVAVELRAAGRFVEICCLGGARAATDGRAVEGLLVSASCLAREAAVGAVRCDGRLAGLVVSRLTAGTEGLTVDSLLSRAAEAAVGATRELRLALRTTPDLGVLVGERVALLEEEEDFLSLVGDLKAEGDLRLLSTAFLGEPVDTGSGLWLLRGFIGGLFSRVDLISATDFGVAVACCVCSVFLGVISAALF